MKEKWIFWEHAESMCEYSGLPSVASYIGKPKQTKLKVKKSKSKKAKKKTNVIQ